MHRKVAVALVAALLLALASCGGSQETQTVSRAQVISRLDAACLAGQRAAREQLRGRAERTTYIRALIANMTTVMDKVGNLETTGRAKADFDAYKDTVRQRIEALERIVSADRADWQRQFRAAQPVMHGETMAGFRAVARLQARHDCI